MAKKRADDEVVSFKFRLPERLRRKLEAEAEKAGRSMNTELLWRLGHTFGEEWQRFIARVEDKERERHEFNEQLQQDPEFQKFIADAIAKWDREKESR
ncbi:MAG TPA: Arc family DNA-binding protein [Xanthobacteraceae bacterium]|nr:Arc family DNA-binding protein [Xanthobacteraceae bacterium]